MVQPIAGHHRNHWATRSTHASWISVLRRAAQIGLDDIEAALLLTAAALVIVYLGMAFGRWLIRPAHVPEITVRVTTGQTLWSLADRYGDPEVYILHRVDDLAALNHLAPGAHLRPGQVVRVPVENPALADQFAVAR